MEKYIQYRRDLHKIPEPARKEFQTSAYIGEKLAKLNCKVETAIETGYTAFFDNNAAETIAFRADIDALPIKEETGLEFAATNGCMHACGHDSHMAMMLAFCDYLSENHGKYKFNILCIFQPSEESIGGARIICETGIFEKLNVKKVFALHIWPKIEKGAIGTVAGPMMAKVSELLITVKGVSAHCGRPDLGINAAEATAQIIARLMDFKKNEIPKDAEYLLHFGKISAGDAGNIIPETSVIMGSVRAFDEKLFDVLQNKIEEVCRTVDAEIGTKTEISYTIPYPPVNNDANLVDDYKKALAAVGIKVIPVDKTVIAEDFSEYEKRAPGVLGWLGCGDVPALHNNKFDFDESLMAVGIKANIALLDYFNK